MGRSNSSFCHWNIRTDFFFSMKLFFFVCVCVGGGVAIKFVIKVVINKIKFLIQNHEN